LTGEKPMGPSAESYWGYIEIRPHWKKKHAILEKYLRACMKFENKYHNFAYLDTHGGSGQLILDGQFTPGSPIIAANVTPTFPCHVIEIDLRRFRRLVSSTRDLPNVQLHKGDCNKIAPGLLSRIEVWKFVFCFLDPDGLVYTAPNGRKYNQLEWRTVEALARGHPKTELLINFPLEAIFRCIGYVEKIEGKRAAETMEERVTQFFGTDDWRKLGNDRTALIQLYLDRLGGIGYEEECGWRRALLIRNEQNSPQYYLVFASRNKVGGKIMFDVMRKEWGRKPLLALPPNTVCLHIFED